MKVNKEMMSKEEIEHWEKGQELHPFSNPISLSLLLLILTNGIGGLAIIILSEWFSWPVIGLIIIISGIVELAIIIASGCFSWTFIGLITMANGIGGLAIIILSEWFSWPVIGLIMCSISLFMLWAGFIDLPTDKRTCMVITIWGIIVSIRGKAVVVGGKTILANYFPLFIWGVKIEVVSTNYNIKVTITTSDGFTLPMEASLTWIPDITDAKDLVKSGGTDNIPKIVDDIVRQNVRTIAAKYSLEQMAKYPQQIADEIKSCLGGDFFDEKSLGIYIQKINVPGIEIPAELLEILNAEKRAAAANAFEGATIKFDRVQILEVLREMRENGEPNATYSDAWKTVTKLNQVASGDTYGLDINAPAGTSLAGAVFHMNAANDKKKGNKGSKKGRKESNESDE